MRSDCCNEIRHYDIYYISDDIHMHLKFNAYHTYPPYHVNLAEKSLRSRSNNVQTRYLDWEEIHPKMKYV